VEEGLRMKSERARALQSVAAIAAIIVMGATNAYPVTTTYLGPGRDPHWSRDGTNRLVYTDTYHIYMIPASGGTATEITDQYAGWIASWPSWSPDGSQVAFWSVAAGLLMSPAAEHADTVAVAVGGGWTDWAEWSPVDDLIAFAGSTDQGDPGVYVCPAASGGYDARVRITSAESRSPCWSPSGTNIAFCAPGAAYGMKRLFIVPSDGSTTPTGVPVTLPLPDNYAQDLWSPDWSPDGRWIACVYTLTSGGNATYSLWAVRPWGGSPVEILPPQGQILAPSWSEDGTQIAYESGGGIWIASDLPTSGTTSVPPSHVADQDLVVFPNPAATPLEIVYRVRAERPIDLTVYDVSGRKIRSLVSGHAPVGMQSATWDRLDDSGAAVAPGTYFLRLTSSRGDQVTERVTILR